ncbi:periplasmic binding protein-like I [Chytriomyces cf. hyalinus JEL632]|nr:periplasmic binding protein-like I [Chytriomyces cf. hyalinus JEL632]
MASTSIPAAITLLPLQNITLGMVAWYCVFPHLVLNGSLTVDGNMGPGLYNYSQIQIGGYDVWAYMADLSVQMAVDSINADPNVLRGVHVEIKRFSDCGPWNGDAQDTWVGRSGGYASTVMAADVVENNPDVLGVVSLQTSSTARYTAQVLSNAQIPMCSADVASPVLSDRNKYSYFWRTLVGAGIGNHFYQVLKYWKVSRVAVIYQRGTDLGYYVYLDVKRALEMRNIKLLGEFALSDDMDPFYMEYIQTSVQKSSARYFIVIGRSEFTAYVMNEMGVRGLTGPNTVFLGINHPKPVRNVTLIFGSDFFKYIQGYVRVAVGPDTSNELFNQTQLDLATITGYPLEIIDMDSYNVPGFVDCVKTMMHGFDKLLRSSKENTPESLASRRLNGQMSSKLFQNTGYQGILSSPLIFDDNGDIKAPIVACHIFGNSFDCRNFGQTDMEATSFSYYPGVQPIFNGGSSIPPPDGPVLPTQLLLSIQSPYGLLVALLSIFGMLWTAFLLWFLLKFRRNDFVKPLASPESFSILFGSGLVYTSMLFHLDNLTTIKCKLSQSLFYGGLIVNLASLIFKNVLIYRIFFKKRGIKPALVAIQVRAAHAFTILTGFIITAFWARQDGNLDVLTAYTVSTVHTACVPKLGIPFRLMFYYAVAFYLSLLPLMILLQKVHWEDFNDSTLIGCLFCMLTVAFTIINYESPKSSAYYDFTFCISIWTVTSVFLVLIFGPRLMGFLWGELMTGETTADRFSRLRTRMAEGMFQRSVKQGSSANLKKEAPQEMRIKLLKKSVYRRKVLFNVYRGHLHLPDQDWASFVVQLAARRMRASHDHSKDLDFNEFQQKNSVLRVTRVISIRSCWKYCDTNFVESNITGKLPRAYREGGSGTSKENDRIFRMLFYSNGV